MTNVVVRLYFGQLILKAQIMTAADDKFCDTFLKFREIIFHENLLPAKDSHERTLIVIFEKETKFEIVSCCKLHV